MNISEACQILGLEPNSFSSKEAKSAWRKQLRVWHPDHNTAPNAAEMVEKINKAYEYIVHPSSEVSPTVNPFESVPNTQFSSQDFHPGAFGDNPWEEEVTADVQTFPINGEDTEIFVSLTTAEALTGTVITTKINFLIACPTCYGEPTSMVNCNRCLGMGRVMSESNQVKIKIPAKTSHQQQIRIAERGNYGLYGGKRGSLIVHTLIEANQNLFKQDGNDLILQIPISLEEFILGVNLNLPTPRGWKKWKVDGPIDLSQEYIIEKTGLETATEVGDLIIDFCLEMPQHMTPEAFAAFQQFIKTLDNPFTIEEMGNPIDVIEQRLLDWKEQNGDLYINDFPLTLQEFMFGGDISISLPHRWFKLHLQPQLDINAPYFIKQAGLPITDDEYGDLYINFILQVCPLNKKQLDNFKNFLKLADFDNPRKLLEKIWDQEMNNS